MNNYGDTCVNQKIVLLPAEGAPIDEEVKQLPGFDGELPSKHYAGYITVGDHAYKRYLYYYFATSERNPLEDPVTLWINGGLDCAGLDALLRLIGPFKLEPNLVHSNGQPKVSSIIVVDSPAGTGYSYTDTTDYTTNDTWTVSDLYEFVIKVWKVMVIIFSHPIIFVILPTENGCL